MGYARAAVHVVYDGIVFVSVTVVVLVAVLVVNQDSVAAYAVVVAQVPVVMCGPVSGARREPRRTCGVRGAAHRLRRTRRARRRGRGRAVGQRPWWRPGRRRERGLSGVSAAQGAYVVRAARDLSSAARATLNVLRGAECRRRSKRPRPSAEGRHDHQRRQRRGR
jgi:hypothetical protein